MRFSITLLMSSASLALSGCGGSPDTAASNNFTVSSEAADGLQGAAEPASGGQAFVGAAAASDSFEIETSKAALTASTSASVKKFAQQMIDAHTESTAKLNAAAAAASLSVPAPMLNAEQQAKLDALKARTGADFDRAYVADQVAGHQQTLDMLKSYAATGDVPALKTFAGEMVPIVTGHLNMAKGLKP